MILAGRGEQPLPGDKLREVVTAPRYLGWLCALASTRGGAARRAEEIWRCAENVAGSAGSALEPLFALQGDSTLLQLESI